MAGVPFIKPPENDDTFHVGDAVEAFCDHDKGKQRVKGWLMGTVVQVDPKMVAVQFKSNVYLTGGWMIPDQILWYLHHSPHIRKKTRSTAQK